LSVKSKHAKPWKKPKIQVLGKLADVSKVNGNEGGQGGQGRRTS